MTGWTWDDISKLTLPRLKVLNNGWKKHPPLPALLAAYLGIKSSNTASSTVSASPKEFAEAGQDHRDLAGIFGGGPSYIERGLNKK